MRKSYYGERAFHGFLKLKTDVTYIQIVTLCLSERQCILVDKMQPHSNGIKTVPFCRSFQVQSNGIFLMRRAKSYRH